MLKSGSKWKQTKQSRKKIMNVKKKEKKRQQTRNATEKTDKHMESTVEIKLTGLRTK